MNGISLDKLFSMTSPIIVDIRDNYSYNLGHIKNAINIPYYNLLGNYSHYLNKNSTYYLYCGEGRQSEEIANRLRSFGYDTYNIIGGYLGYLDYDY